MRRPAEIRFPQAGAVPFRAVKCSSGPFIAHVCSPFAPHCAPRVVQHPNAHVTISGNSAAQEPAAMIADPLRQYDVRAGIAQERAPIASRCAGERLLCARG